MLTSRVSYRSLLSTPTGVDRLLSLMYYLSTLLSPLLSRLALRLTIKLPTPVPLIVLTPASSVLTTAAYRLRLLAARVSDVRTFLRLLGLVGMYNWGASTLRNPPADPMVRGLMLAQVAVNCCFQALENAAYLNKHGILAFAKRTESHMALWSTRCWAAHIVLEFVRLERVRSLARDKKGTDEEKAAARRAWLKAWVRNAASAPLSVCFCPSSLLRSSLMEGHSCMGAWRRACCRIWPWARLELFPM